MAFTNKPFIWKNNGVTPPETLQNSGFVGGKKLPAPYVNAQWTATYKAIEELQQKAGEVKTVNNIQPDSNGNVLITLPDTSKLYQKPTSGIPKTDLDTSVQASLKKADDAAPLTELAKTNQALTTHQADNVSHDTYVSCSTTGATAEKVVTSVGFTLVEGARITVKFTNANTTTTPTLKINTEDAKPLVKADGTAFKNIKAGVYSFVYDGSGFIVQGEGGEYGTATASDVVAGKTFGTENGLQTGNLTIASLGGKRWASGVKNDARVDYAAYQNGVVQTINNLPFKPSVFSIYWTIQGSSSGTLSGFTLNKEFGADANYANYMERGSAKVFDGGFSFILRHSDSSKPSPKYASVQWEAYE